MTLWKKKGSKANMKNNRDITLTDTDSKASAKTVRKRFVGLMSNLTIETQMGSGLH